MHTRICGCLTWRDLAEVSQPCDLVEQPDRAASHRPYLFNIIVNKVLVETMNDRNDDVVTQGRDASSKLPSAQSLMNNPDIAPVQRSGSWSWRKLSSTGRDSTSPNASVDQGFASAADQTPAGASGGWSAAPLPYLPYICMGIWTFQTIRKVLQSSPDGV
jgi:hypothetical protein